MSPPAVAIGTIHARNAAIAIDNDVPTRIGEAIGQLYLARGLLAGSALLVARARLTAPQDKPLRREVLGLVKEVGNACAGCARAADASNPVISARADDTASPASVTVAAGLCRAAIASLEAMEACDETDEALQALDLLHLAADTLKAAGRNFTRAFDMSSRRHAGAGRLKRTVDRAPTKRQARGRVSA